MQLVSAPELRIEISQVYRDEKSGRTVPFVALGLHVQILNNVLYLDVITRRLPRMDVAGLNSKSDPRYPEFHRIYSTFNEARKELFRRIATDSAFKAHRDVVRETLLRRLDEQAESCFLNQDCSLLCLRFVAEDFFGYPYRLFLKRYPSLFHSVSEREFLLKIQALRMEWRQYTRVAIINQTARACPQKTQYRFVQAGIEKFAAKCILDPNTDTGLCPQPDTNRSVQEIVLADENRRNLAIETVGAELLSYDRRLAEPVEETIRRVARGDIETEKALIELCDTPGINTLADLARYQWEKDGRPSPTRQQLINFARDFRKKHKLVERAIESGVARDAGYTEEDFDIWRRTGKLARPKLPALPRSFYDPRDFSTRTEPNFGESTGKPDAPEVLLRSLLRVSTTVHYDRIAGKVVYAHDSPQPPTPLPVKPFQGVGGSMRVLYSPSAKQVGEGNDAMLESESTVGGGKNFHKDLLAMVNPPAIKLYRRNHKGKSKLVEIIKPAPITPRSWVSKPRLMPLVPVSPEKSLASAPHKVVLKTIPLDGPSPDPGTAMRPVVVVALRPTDYNAGACEGAALVGNISTQAGERRLHNLPHDDALEAANRDRIFSDDRYGHVRDLPACPPGTGHRGKAGLREWRVWWRSPISSTPWFTPANGKTLENWRGSRRSLQRALPRSCSSPSLPPRSRNTSCSSGLNRLV